MVNPNQTNEFESFLSPRNEEGGTNVPMKDINALEERIEALERMSESYESHQHGSDDGSEQIYNEPIRLKPGNYIKGGLVSLGDGEILTIKTGKISVNTSYHKIETEGAAATDDLDTINSDNAVEGQLLVIKPVSGSRTVVVKNGTGNLEIGSDFTMSFLDDVITLIWSGTNWIELSRANN